MKVIGVIPARFGSTRLPGKPLLDICGHPMIWWTYNNVKNINELDAVFVATDDERIAEYCDDASIPYLMTKNNHNTAASRLYEVSLKIDADFYLQINGDEPLLNKEAIIASIPKTIPSDVEFGTNIITKMNDPAQVLDPSNIKMVFDNEMNALYMSRTAIPNPYKSLDFKYYKHTGIIGYNKKMLEFYNNSTPGRFETIEGIDTLRFLDYGKQLKLIIVDSCHNLSVDTAKDLEEIRKIIGSKIS